MAKNESFDFSQMLFCGKRRDSLVDFPAKQKLSVSKLLKADLRPFLDGWQFTLKNGAFGTLKSLMDPLGGKERSQKNWVAKHF
jgi:hypothetical protein